MTEDQQRTIREVNTARALLANSTFRGKVGVVELGDGYMAAFDVENGERRYRAFVCEIDADTTDLTASGAIPRTTDLAAGHLKLANEIDRRTNT